MSKPTGLGLFGALGSSLSERVNRATAEISIYVDLLDKTFSPGGRPYAPRPSSASPEKNNVVTSSPKRFSHQELVQLSEIETEDDLLELSVKQMKEILALNRVMFKGVIEKEELLKIVRRLWLQDKRNNEDKDTMDDEELCKICMDSKVDCVMLECGHISLLKAIVMNTSTYTTISESLKPPHNTHRGY
ncbi:RNF34 [Lepeophtheirus salmonis]|uniref:RNF34 n=1 Tax=Lepeophtheirus salmonis TaxID=72036 RepID=A0A7R8CEK3_LEPSM|nr:RNF34 [Lepeophtheirus salmonis]CAF2791931.1 RNF34 [Lepeophtheirus salmonis]